MNVKLKVKLKAPAGRAGLSTTTPTSGVWAGSLSTMAPSVGTMAGSQPGRPASALASASTWPGPARPLPSRPLPFPRDLDVFEYAWGCSTAACVVGMCLLEVPFWIWCACGFLLLCASSSA